MKYQSKFLLGKKFSFKTFFNFRLEKRVTYIIITNLCQIVLHSKSKILKKGCLNYIFTKFQLLLVATLQVTAICLKATLLVLMLHCHLPFFNFSFFNFPFFREIHCQLTIVLQWDSNMLSSGPEMF